MDEDQENNVGAESNSDDIKYPTGQVIIDGNAVKGRKEGSLAVSRMDNQILADAEKSYSKTVDEVIRISGEQLTEEGKNKQKLRFFFTIFFSIFIASQFVILSVVIFLLGLQQDFVLPDGVLTAYIASVFVETLGVVALMVKFVFNSQEEVKIIDILNAVVVNYQKFNRKD